MITCHTKPSSVHQLRLKSATQSTVIRAVVGAVTLICADLARADLITRELGENLRYFRTHVLPTELPGADVPPGPVILDLRYAQAGPEAVNALDAWLKFRATPATPVVILVNPDTAETLRDVVTPASKRADVVTVGRKIGEAAPDILIEAADDEERRAYDALEHSTSIETLITENADKPRMDEASIMRERADGVDRPFAAENRSTPEKKAEAPAASLIDRALQRAIHLHRALLALRRLPE